MRKPIIALILIVILGLLNSCTIENSVFFRNSELSQSSSDITDSNVFQNSRTRMLDAEDDNKVADDLFQQVIDAIKNKDKVALKALFSKNALNNAVDLDKSVDTLLGFIEGEISTWVNPDGGPGASESINYGHITKELFLYYNVNTDTQKYFFLVDFYPIDTDHPDNVGIYTIMLSKVEDEDTVLSGYRNVIYPGIYIINSK